MIRFIRDWYQRHFNDPQVALLAVLLILGFAVVLIAGKPLQPLLAAIVIAYLLDGAVESLVQYKVPRFIASTIVFVAFCTFFAGVMLWLVPLLISQMTQFFGEVPIMASRGQAVLMQLPERYPQVLSENDVINIISQIRSELGGMGQKVLSLSVASAINVFTALVYLVLVPVLIFFLLKDKSKIFRWASGFLPEERSLSMAVWTEMNAKIASYARGKAMEIIIVWVSSYIVFLFLGLNYALLLALIVGLSVIIPYVGAAAATLPVALIAYFQWGFDSQFMYVLGAYAVLQFLDGNVLVPLLFSEVVNLHPIAIIAAVLFFGGLWGVWGVFFAIPLATLVQAVINVWPAPSDVEAIASENQESV